MTETRPSGLDLADAEASPSDAPLLLITGFGPFPGVADNPSGRFAAGIDGHLIEGVRVAGRVIPVHWRDAWPHIEAHIEALRPDALLMLGVASERTRVEVELIGRNHTRPSLDAAGELPDASEVVPGGPSDLATRLPWSALTGPDIGTSTDAGAYLCNQVLYRALHTAPERLPICGFVHVPAWPTEATGRLVVALARRLRAVRDLERDPARDPPHDPERDRTGREVIV